MDHGLLIRGGRGVFRNMLPRKLSATWAEILKRRPELSEFLSVGRPAVRCRALADTIPKNVLSGTQKSNIVRDYGPQRDVHVKWADTVNELVRFEDYVAQGLGIGVF